MLQNSVYFQNIFTNIISMFLHTLPYFTTNFVSRHFHGRYGLINVFCTVKIRNTDEVRFLRYGFPSEPCTWSFRISCYLDAEVVRKAKLCFKYGVSYRYRYIYYKRRGGFKENDLGCVYQLH
uniref:Uncharacterized protein n=1 Tax=Cacopsylla melanoneura TaxID=428564 RepID=A0A8D9BR17_9HEMI